jgi:hypothetical protein
MHILLKLFWALLLIFGISLGYGKLLLHPKITRARFALALSFLLGMMFFLLSITFGGVKLLGVGLIFLILGFPGGYPIAYYLYPIMKARAQNRINKIT